MRTTLTECISKHIVINLLVLVCVSFQDLERLEMDKKNSLELVFNSAALQLFSSIRFGNSIL